VIAEHFIRYLRNAATTGILVISQMNIMEPARVSLHSYSYAENHKKAFTVSDVNRPENI
jgi:hypothetical protein